ncbi:MAG: hypothetical protein AAF389_21280 [Gemmatimonadota bacterium]
MNNEAPPMISYALRAAAILWVVWGLVHAFAGVMIISSDTAAALQAIADGVEPGALAIAYPDAAGAVINQHGFNLLWIGIVTMAAAPYIWRGSATAIFIAAMVGGLADIGYFVFLDLGGYVRFVPGTLMTVFSASAILLSFGAHFRGKGGAGS